MSLKAIAIACTLLCVSVLATSDQPKFVEKLNQHTSNSSTFWFLYRLYTVKKNDTHIEISKTNEDYENFEVQCTATLNPDKDRIVDRMRAIPGVYTMNIYGVDNVEKNDKTRKTQYKTLLVNHLNCTYATIKLPVEEVPVDYPVLPPLVKDDVYGFDFFYPNKDCSPCLVFTDNGYIKPKEQVKIDIGKPSRSMLLKETRWPHDNPYGHFYAYNFANGTALVRFLSKNYEVIKEKYVNYPIDAADVSYSHTKKTTYVGFCYGNGTSEVHCGQYDDDLKIRSVNSLKLLDDTYASGMTVKVDKQGRSMIGLMQSPLKQKDNAHQVSFFIYDSEGKIIEDTHVGKIEGKYQDFELNSWFYDYGSRQEYCIHVDGRENAESTDAHEMIQCRISNEDHTNLS